MTNYWKTYWDDHFSSLDNNNEFKQVLRVQDKNPQSNESFEQMIVHIKHHLEALPFHRLLDLCCGNGLITKRFYGEVEHITAVDFCSGLLDCLRKKQMQSMTCILGDVQDLKFPEKSFDRILLAAALQHFSESQVVDLFEKVSSWMTIGGRFFITDILDVTRKWDFFNSEEREKVYFEHLKTGKPLLGTWFSEDWITKLAKHAGFSSSTLISQPKNLVYSHYRFDLLLEK